MFSILFFGPLMAASAFVQSQPKWTYSQFWRQNLRAKMTESTVRNALGEPTDREATSSAMIWYYHECPTRVEGKVSHRPNRGIVRFRLVRENASGQRLDKPYFAVVDWIEPDWDEVEVLLQIKKGEAEAEAAQKLAEAEKVRIAAEQEQERLRVEREKAEQEKLLANQKRDAEEQARIETERERLEAEEARKWLGFQKEYWYFAGGGFIVAIVLVVLFKRAGTDTPY